MDHEQVASTAENIVDYGESVLTAIAASRIPLTMLTRPGSTTTKRCVWIRDKAEVPPSKRNRLDDSVLQGTASPPPTIYDQEELELATAKTKPKAAAGRALAALRLYNCMYIKHI